MGPIGVQEMVVIFLVALVLFGPRKLPELAKNIGKAVTEFRRAQSELKETFQREMHTIERENEALKEVTRQTAAELSTASAFDAAAYLPQHTDPPAGAHSAPETPSVGASAVSGAESHAAPYDGSYKPDEYSAEHSSGHNAESAQAQGNPLPEFVQAGGGSHAKADAELPSI